jgi:hypothetical protein
MDTKPLNLNCMLECGHTVVWRGGVVPRGLPDTMQCGWCVDRLTNDPVGVKVHAVECREWWVRCQSCRYSRWFGASKLDADSASGRHTVAHPTHVVGLRYCLHPDKFTFVRTHLGKKMRVRIEGAPVLRVVVKYKIEDEECPF